MADRNLDHLHPKVAAAAKAAISECNALGLKLLVTCTHRTGAEQAALFAQGRTTPGPKVTFARPGESLHQYGMALDLYPMVNGKPEFSGKHPNWEKIAAVFKKHGFEWGFDWKKFKEKPHFQMTFGHPLSWFQAGNVVPK